MNPDYGYIVNVPTSVDLMKKKLKEIPIKFGEIEGEFLCNDNFLFSLEFSPITLNGDYYCNKNNIQSLKGVTKHIPGSFDSSNKQLISLQFGPVSVENAFKCSFNKLKSL